MTIQTVPLTLPPSADPSKFANFGREVIGVDPGNLSSSDFAQIRQLLYRVQLSIAPHFSPRG
jgi:xanthine dioxygenase